jgi:hypothetical protein
MSIEVPLTLNIFGGPIAPDLSKHLFGIQFDCEPMILDNSSRNNAKSVVGRVGGLRVLLMDLDPIEIRPDPNWEIDDDTPDTNPRQLRAPLLLRIRSKRDQKQATMFLRAAAVRTTSIVLIRENIAKDLAGQPGSTQSHELVLSPIRDGANDWPKQTTPAGSGSAIVLPPLLLTAGSIPIWIGSKSDLGKFLNLDDQKKRVLKLLMTEFVPNPHGVENVLDDSDFGINASLTPDGIEFSAKLPGIDGKDSDPCLLRLTWNPNSSERSTIPYVLRLISGDAVRPYYSSIAAKLNKLAENNAPLVVDFDTSARSPRVTWPIQVGPKAEFIGQRNAGNQWTKWTARVDVEPDPSFDPGVKDTVEPSVRATLITKLTPTSEPNAAELNLDQVELGLDTSRFFVRLNGAAGSTSPQTVNSEWNLTVDKWSASEISLTGRDVSIPAELLRQRLLPIYLAAGALPPEETDAKYAFAPLDKGWLQLPFRPRVKPTSSPATAGVPRKGFQGEYHAPLHGGVLGGDTDRGRMLTVFDAAKVAVRADWDTGNTKPIKIQASAEQAHGQVTGLLFVSETSPTSTEVIPTLAGGPVSTRTLPIVFGESPGPSDWTGTFSKTQAGTGASTCQLSLKKLDTEGYRAWLRPDEMMPFISTMPLTRTARSALVPSHTRGLAPATLQADISLEWSGSQATPTLKRNAWQWDDLCFPNVPSGNAIADPFSGIALTLPALPGVVFAPVSKAVSDTLAGALRFDLAILDELFSQTKLPKHAGSNPNTNVSTVSPLREMPRPTALQPADLQKWRRTIFDELNLSVTEQAVATQWVKLESTAAVEITGLVEPFVWKTDFGVVRRSSNPALTLPLGFIKGINGTSLPQSPDEALKGVDQDVALQGGPTLRITGFAAPIYSNGGFSFDTRGFGQTPTTVRKGQSLIRAAKIVGDGASDFSLVTLIKPFSFQMGSAAKFWFSNLPCANQSGQLVFDGINSPYENGGGFAGQGFDRKNLGKSGYEWRLFSENSLQYTLDIGPFAFRPLTLRNVTLDNTGNLISFLVVGSVNASQPHGPLNSIGPDEPHAHDNLALLSFRTDTGYQIGAFAEGGSPPLVFPLEIDVRIGASSSPTRGELRLAWKQSGTLGDSSLTATLACRLFGQDWTFGDTQGVPVKMLPVGGDAGFTVTFKRPDTAKGFAVDVDEMVLKVVNAGGIWKASLDVPLRISVAAVLFDPVVPASPDAAPAFRWEKDEAKWFDLKFSNTPLNVNHDSGRMGVTIRTPEITIPEGLGELFSGFDVGNCQVHGVVELLAFPNTAAAKPWPRIEIPTAFWLEIDANPPKSDQPSVADVRLRHIMCSKGMPVLNASGSGKQVFDDRRTSLLTVSRQIQGASGIFWPLDINFQLAQGEERSQKATVLSAGTAATDTVSIVLKDHEVPIHQLRISGASPIFLQGVWRCLATVEHLLSETHKWRSTEYIFIAGDDFIKTTAKTLIDERASLSATHTDVLAFTPRNRKNHYRGVDSRPFMRHPGLATTAMAAAGFSDPHLLAALAGAAATSGLIVFGGAPTLFQLGNGKGTFATTTSFVMANRPLGASASTHPVLSKLQTDIKGTWSVSEYDIQPLGLDADLSAAATVSAGSSEQEIALAAKKVLDGAPANAIPINQAFFEALDANGKPADMSSMLPAQVPYFLGTLLILKQVVSLWDVKSPPEVDTLLSASLHASTCRLRVSVGDVRTKQQVESSVRTARMIVLDRSGMIYVSPAIRVAGEQVTMPAGQKETPIAYLGEEARLLAHDPRSVLLTVFKSDSIFPQAVDLPPATDDLGFALSVDPTTVVRRGVSPALGWPCEDGIEIAAPLAPTLGDELPFSDGQSGFAGRRERFAFPAFAPMPTADGVQGNIFVRLATHVTFARPKGGSELGPAGRHLLPARVRARMPVDNAISQALLKVKIKSSAGFGPILPSEVERGDIGARPGVLHVFGTSLATSTGVNAFDTQVERFGKPSTIGAPILHQVRAPRSPALPPDRTDAEFGFRRRTFLSKADRLPGDPPNRDFMPFLIFPGSVGILRKQTKDGVDWRFALQLAPALSIDGKWNGALSVAYTSARGTSDAISSAAGELGITGKPGPSYSLRIGNQSFPFVAKSTGTLVHDLQPATDLDPIRAALDAANADTKIALVATIEPAGRVDVQGAIKATPIQIKASKHGLNDGDSIWVMGIKGMEEANGFWKVIKVNDDQIKLQDSVGNNEYQSGGLISKFPLPTGPARILNLPIELAPGTRQTLSVQRNTLVFGDPSYDRQLSSETRSITARIPNGEVYLLSVDRPEYDLESTLYVAIGGFDPKSNSFKNVTRNVQLSFAIQPRSLPGEDPKTERTLRVAMNPSKKDYEFVVDGLPPIFAIPVTGFLEDSGSQLLWKDGDSLVVSARVRVDGVLSDAFKVSVRIVDVPIINPNPAVFSLLRQAGDSVDVPLHASSPLPNDIEFPNLLKDLASGHIRRMGLFTWDWAEPAVEADQRAFLVKVDRAGGGQMPNADSDFLPLPP